MEQDESGLSPEMFAVRESAPCPETKRHGGTAFFVPDGQGAAVLLCVFVLSGVIRTTASATGADDSRSLVDTYCSQTAIDALGYEQLQALVDLIVTSIEPQAVNFLIERFPCFQEAAEKDELGLERRAFRDRK